MNFKKTLSHKIDFHFHSSHCNEAFTYSAEMDDFKRLITKRCIKSNKKITHVLFFNPFPNDKLLDSSKPKELADDNFEFIVNGRNFSERVENTVGTGENACFEQFLLFSKCFQKTCTVDT